MKGSEIISGASTKRARGGWAMPVLLVALLVPWGLCGDAADEAAANGQAGPAPVRPGEFFGTVVTGGFRSVFIDYLWMRTDILERQRDNYELRATYEALAYFQPHAEEVWVYNGRNMVDIATQYQTASAKYAWIRAGFVFAVKGIEYNPDSVIIRNYLAQAFYDRFSYDNNQYSREFRRLLREDPDKSFLRDAEHADAVRESLLYWDDLVKAAPDVPTHKGRAYAALTLLGEQEVGKREARLDMLEAREKYLTAPAEERESSQEIYEKRGKEYESALNAPKELSAEEEESLRARVRESAAYVERQGEANLRIVEAIGGWEDSCRVVLGRIDIALELYDKALGALENAGAGVSGIPRADEVKALEDTDITDIMPVNGVYVTPIYAEAVEKLKRLAGKKESES
jgi:hypothetical protein